MSNLTNLYHSKNINVFWLILICSLFFLKNSFTNESAAIKKIVIDAGHGGKDSGTMGTKRYKKYEKHIALEISLKLGKYIEDNFPQIEVIYTRKNDKFLELRERTKIANNKKADLFISIHCDGFTNSNASGASVFVMGMSKLKENMDIAMRENSVIYLEDNYKENYNGFDPKSAESYIVFSVMQNSHLSKSIDFAERIEYEFSNKAKRKSRGVKQAPFYVISRVNMPSVLVEAGFLTNPKEEDYLHTVEGQDHIASAIFRAFKAYYKSESSKKLVNNKFTKDTTKNIDHSINTSQLIYKVQIGTYSKSMLKNKVFKKIENIEEKKYGEKFKYFIVCGKNRDEAENIKFKVNKMGFSGAFIVAFYNGSQISTKEALNLRKSHE